MNMNDPENIEQHAKKVLDESVNDLSPDITRRLQQARYAAIEKAKARSVWSFYPQAITTLFAVAVVSMSLWFSMGEPDMTEIALTMETEIEMLTSNETLELMEDLEFIQWLAESQEYAS